MRYGYLHGFASGPGSYKGTKVAEAFAARGIPLDRLDVNAPSFAMLTYSAALGVVDAWARGDVVTLIGSSMGGYLAARWAELHPEQVDRLVLLCPGFDLPTRWPKILGPGAMERWKRDGWLEVKDAAQRPVLMHWGFVEDAARHPSVPRIVRPTLIVHGTRDATVPIESSRAVAAGSELVRLVEVDDDHDLVDALPRIVAETLAFLGLEAAAADPTVVDGGRELP